MPSSTARLRRDLPAEIAIPDPVVVSDLAEALRVKPFRIISKLIPHKVFVTADRSIDFATASLVCASFGVQVRRLG